MTSIIIEIRYLNTVSELARKCGCTFSYCEIFFQDKRCIEIKSSSIYLLKQIYGAVGESDIREIISLN